MRALDDMENANAQVEVSVEEVTKARTQKIKVFHSSICYDPSWLLPNGMKACLIIFAFILLISIY